MYTGIHERGSWIGGNSAARTPASVEGAESEREREREKESRIFQLTFTKMTSSHHVRSKPKTNRGKDKEKKKKKAVPHAHMLGMLREDTSGEDRRKRYSLKLARAQES